MSFLAFLTASGALAWMFLCWRAYSLVRGLPRRLRWALWGHSERRRRARVGYQGKSWDTVAHGPTYDA